MPEDPRQGPANGMGPVGVKMGTGRRIDDVRGDIHVLARPWALREARGPPAGVPWRPLLKGKFPRSGGVDIVLRKTRLSGGAASGTRLGRGTAMDRLPFGNTFRQLINLGVRDRSSCARVLIIIIIAPPPEQRSRGWGSRS